MSFVVVGDGIGKTTLFCTALSDVGHLYIQHVLVREKHSKSNINVILDIYRNLYNIIIPHLKYRPGLYVGFKFVKNNCHI